MDLLLIVPIAVALALVTLVLCDLAGSIARAKGRSYWLFFVVGLLLWFPALITALVLPDRDGSAAGPDPRRTETALATAVVVLGALAAAAGIGAALAYSP